MNFYLQFAPMMFLLQLALAILSLIHPMAFHVQLPFVFSSEQAPSGRVVTIIPCCASTIWERAGKVDWDGKKSLMCEWGTPCDQQYGAEEAHLKCRHINKRQPTGHGQGQSSHNFSGKLV